MPAVWTFHINVPPTAKFSDTFEVGRLPGQFSDGRSTRSITNVSTRPFAGSSRNPNAAGRAVKIDSSSSGGDGASTGRAATGGGGRGARRRAEDGRARA